MYAGEIVGIDNVVGIRGDDHFLVGVDRARLMGGDEGRADIGHVCAHCLGGQDRAAIGDRAGQQQRPVEPLTDFLDQREGRKLAGMAAGARRHGNEAVCALSDGGIGMPVVDHVVQYDAAIGLNRLVDLRHGAERGDDDRHLVFDAHHQIVLETLVRGVDDLVDGKRRGRTLRVFRVVIGQFLGDLGQPFVKLGLRTRVQRRKRTDHAGLALGERQIGMRNDEKRRCDHRQAQVVFQNRRQSHGSSRLVQL